jgi:hypothetical protein
MRRGGGGVTDRYWTTDGQVYIGDPYGDARELTYEEYHGLWLQSLPPQYRRIRDQKILEVEWRVRRYQDEQVLDLPHSDDIVRLAAYIQALRDVPQQPGFPESVVWPVLD